MSTETEALGQWIIPENSLQKDPVINRNAETTSKAMLGIVGVDLIADANRTLLQTEYVCSVMVIGDSGTVLTTGRDMIYPALFPRQTVINATAETLTLKMTGQTGITLAAGGTTTIVAGLADVIETGGGGGGGGAVSSVNGATGAVVLDDGDVKSVVTALTSGTTVTVDCSLGRNFTLTLGHNVGTLTLSNLAGSGHATEIEIEIKQDGTGGRTFALPASFKALGGSDTAIASAANAVTVLSAKTFDNGTTWRYAMQESA